MSLPSLGPAKWTTSQLRLCNSLICFYFLYITYCYLKLYYAFQVFHFLPWLRAHTYLFCDQIYSLEKSHISCWQNGLTTFLLLMFYHRPSWNLGLCVLATISRFVVEVCFLLPSTFWESPIPWITIKWPRRLDSFSSSQANKHDGHSENPITLPHGLSMDWHGIKLLLILIPRLFPELSVHNALGTSRNK